MDNFDKIDKTIALLDKQDSEFITLTTNLLSYHFFDHGQISHKAVFACNPASRHVKKSLGSTSSFKTKLKRQGCLNRPFSTGDKSYTILAEKRSLLIICNDAISKYLMAMFAIREDITIEVTMMEQNGRSNALLHEKENACKRVHKLVPICRYKQYLFLNRAIVSWPFCKSTLYTNTNTFMIYALEIPKLRNVLHSVLYDALQPSVELSLRNCTQKMHQILLVQKLFYTLQNMPFLALKPKNDFSKLIKSLKASQNTAKNRFKEKLISLFKINFEFKETLQNAKKLHIFITK